MKLFKNVAIVGVGLIGGSIALGIKKRGLAKKIIGVSRHKKTLLLAKKNKAIDKGSLDIDIVKDADLIIFATPVNTILKLAPEISKIIGPNCIVTDVGSTKLEIVEGLEKIFPNYVGSHPLAGSEKRGIGNAYPDIFKNSLCILTPTKSTNIRALNQVQRLWQLLGARIKFLTPEGHDKALSFVSHLPHAVAFSLMETMPGEHLKFAANGLKDTTRLAASDAELWSDIFLSNSKNLIRTIDAFQKNLSSLKNAVKEKDRSQLYIILKKAKAKRDSLDC